MIMLTRSSEMIFNPMRYTDHLYLAVDIHKLYYGIIPNSWKLFQDFKSNLWYHTLDTS